MITTPLVEMAGELPFGKSHHPNQFTHQGMVKKLVSTTLIAFPMNVASEARRPSVASTGLKYFISSITTGNNPSSTTHLGALARWIWESYFRR